MSSETTARDYYMQRQYRACCLKPITVSNSSTKFRKSSDCIVEGSGLLIYQELGEQVLRILQSLFTYILVMSKQFHRFSIICHSMMAELQVLFAICHDKAPLEEIERVSGKAISISTSAAGGVQWSPAEESDLKASSTGTKPKRRLKISIPRWCGKWVVGMDDFKDGVVGAKSKNLAGETSHNYP